MLAIVGRESGFSPPLKVLSRSAPSLSMTMNLKFVCASLEHPEYSNVIWLRHSCRHTYPQVCQFSTTLTKQHIEPPNSYRHSTPTSNYLSFSSPTVWLPYPQSAGRCAGPLQAFKCSGLNKKIVEVDPDQQQFGRAGTTCQQQDNSATRQREVRSHGARSSLHICALSHPELFKWFCWREENEMILFCKSERETPAPLQNRWDQNHQSPQCPWGSTSSWKHPEYTQRNLISDRRSLVLYMTIHFTYAPNTRF